MSGLYCLTEGALAKFLVNNEAACYF